MSTHDVLCHAFSFLDYSHIKKLCLVCKEWNMIASSNNLWEFYFHLLSNNRNGKTKVPTETINNDPRFWKHKIRDNFATYNCRISNKITPRYLNLSGTFPDKFSSQVVKMILSRMYLESMYFTTNLKKPFELTDGTINEDNYDDRPRHYKITMKISGIEGKIIMRMFYSSYRDEFGLFGYNYTEHFYLYFAKENDDKLNEEFFIKESNTVNVENIGKSGRAFIYNFKGKSNPGIVYGKEYLIREILDYLVPTVTAFKMSPLEFIPYWCLLFDIIIHQEAKLKEVYKHYPNMISNPLVYRYFSYYYYSRYRSITDTVKNQFSLFKPKNETERRILHAITYNQPIKFESENREKLINGNNACFNLIGAKPSQLFPPLIAAASLSEEEYFETKLKYSARIYRMCENFDEYMEWFLERKFKRPFQIQLNE